MPCDASDGRVAGIEPNDVHDLSLCERISAFEHCAVLAHGLRDRILDSRAGERISEQPQRNLLTNAWATPEPRQDLGRRNDKVEELCSFFIVEFLRLQSM